MTEVIHILQTEADPQHLNGINTMVYQLALQQSLSGRKISVWEITAENSPASSQEQFQIRFFRKDQKKFGIDKVLEDAIKAMQGLASFHLHGGFIPEYFTISKILKEINVPFVFTPHGAYNQVAMHKYSYLKAWYIKFFERKVLQRATSIHCLGKSELEGLRVVYPKARAVLLPCGFSIPTARSAAPERNKFVLGFVGRLDIYSKGLDLLINAFAFVKQVHPRSELWIIGDSEEREQLNRQISSRGLQDDIIMWGNKVGEERLKLLSKVNMFVHPSRNEGLPSSVIEAAAMGIPCVVSEASNIGTPVRNFDCGEVVNDPDETQLFNAIMNLYYRIDLDGISSFSEKARRMVAQEYAWDAIILQFDSLYKVA